MKRDYEDGERDDVTFFIGTEVESTPANGMKTLFVTGVQDVDEISGVANISECGHIYLGANQSFDPKTERETLDWEHMIKTLLEQGFLVTLDFDVKHVEWVIEGGYSENDRFIPQISVKIPYIRQLNYNATLKIDDKGFKASNPGVWCHSLHDLQDRSVFTGWEEYSGDKPL